MISSMEDAEAGACCCLSVCLQGAGLDSGSRSLRHTLKARDCAGQWGPEYKLHSLWCLEVWAGMEAIGDGEPVSGAQRWIK